MGRKLKTLDHLQADDKFDKLLLESHLLPTVVLMLDSPEDDVVIKASNAIYWFSEKCDENKLALLDTNAIDKLLRLLHNDERGIRRSSSMAIASMSQHPDVRKVLRKRQETIPLLIRLLICDDDLVVLEFVTLCLSSMAVDYTCKHSLCFLGAMEPLIACLRSTDPDVQKNSIQTIYLMLQDYPSKTALNELQGLPSILVLLESEYPVIQYYALLALQLAAEDGENRLVLRDAKISKILTDFMLRSDNVELHVFALMALINCMEDRKTMQVFKDSGGLQRLILLITEKTEPTPDEEKKTKKEKTTTSKGGKKSKQDDENDKQKNKILEMLSITSLPEMKEQVARAIASAARNADCRKILHEQEAEKQMIKLLGHDKQSVQAAAVTALGVMANSPVIRARIVDSDGLDPLVKLSKIDNNPVVMQAVALAFANLTSDSPTNASELFKRGIADTMMTMLSSCPTELTAVYSALTLHNLSTFGGEPIRTELINGGRVIPSLVEALNSKSTLIKEKSLFALSSYVIDAHAQNQLMETDCVDVLLSLLSHGDDLILQSSSFLVYLLSTSNESIASEFCNKGGLIALKDIQLSPTRNNSISEMALEKLFDADLTSKFAFTGHLSSSNLITDGFYDCGRLNRKDRLKSLEENSKETIDQNRPIIIVNPKQPPAITPSTVALETFEVTEKSSRTSGNVSRLGRDAKGKKSQKEKEEKMMKEEELLIQQQKEAEKQAAAASASGADVAKGTELPDAATTASVPYVPPADALLLQYINEIKDIIPPLSDTNEQIQALARYVSEKMGGAMSEETLAKSDWEAKLIQLKKELNCNVVPLGSIRVGIQSHRALLFKVLADRIALPCSLFRGEYNRAWIVVSIRKQIIQNLSLTYEIENFIVDLMEHPGQLFEMDSCDANCYQRSMII